MAGQLPVRVPRASFLSILVIQGLVPTRGRDGPQAAAETALMDAINALLAHEAAESPSRRDGGAVLISLKQPDG